MEKSIEEILSQHEKGRKFISIDDNSKVVVDWKKIANFRFRSETPSGTIYEDILKMLKDLEILSFNNIGNYVLLGSGVELNPKINMVRLYFTRKEDAQEYKQEKYSKALYNVMVRKLVKE